MILKLLCWLQHCQGQQNSMIHILVFSVVQDDQSLINITQLLVSSICSMNYSSGQSRTYGIHSLKYDILNARYFCHMDFSPYN